MAVTLHWFLPTNGDSRSDLSLGNAVGVRGSRVSGESSDRAPDVGYIGQIARSAEQLAGLDADQIARSQAVLGIDEFILSGYPHLEEAYRVGEGVIPELRRRGLLGARTADLKPLEV